MKHAGTEGSVRWLLVETPGSCYLCTMCSEKIFLAPLNMVENDGGDIERGITEINDETNGICHVRIFCCAKKNGETSGMSLKLDWIILTRLEI